MTMPVLPSGLPGSMGILPPSPNGGTIPSGFASVPPPNDPDFNAFMEANVTSSEPTLWYPSSSHGSAIYWDGLLQAVTYFGGPLGPNYFTVNLKLTSPGGNSVTVPVSLAWNNENAWSGLAFVGTQVSWPAGEGTYPFLDGADITNTVLMPAPWGYLTWAPGDLGQFVVASSAASIFPDIDIAQLLVCVNAIAIPSGLPANLQIWNDDVYLQAPLFCIAYGIRILETSDLTKPALSILAQSPFFYPGDTRLSFQSGGSIEQPGQTTRYLYVNNAATASPTYPKGSFESVNDGLSISSLTFAFADTPAAYTVAAQSSPDPSVQLPNLVNGMSPTTLRLFLESQFPGATLSIVDFFGNVIVVLVNNVSVAMIPVEYADALDQQYYRLLGNGKAVMHGLTYLPPGEAPNPSAEFGQVSLVQGSWTGPTVAVPMTGTKNYTLYLG